MLKGPLTRTARLQCGLTLVSNELPWVHTVVCQVVLPLGSQVEKSGQKGLCHLIEHLLFRGSALYSTSEHLMRAFEALGAEVFAWTGVNCMVIGFEAEPNDVADVLHVLLNMVLSPLLSEEQYLNELSVIDAEIRSDSVDYRKACRAHLLQTIWGDGHPIGRPVAGTLFHSGLQAGLWKWAAFMKN
ncbi:MAG: insulinase family protein [Bacillota bacterium]|nr:insulinase family protein [Bacillota bacterium]